MKVSACFWATMGAVALGALLWISLVARVDAAPTPPVTPTPPAERSAAPRPSTQGTSGPVASAASPTPEPRGVPDLTQSDPRLELPDEGASYCGPVAVSNGLAWLAGRGYPRLLPAAASEEGGQLALVQALSSRRYMGTSPIGGTGSLSLLRGLERWIGDAGYVIDELEYSGWRAHDARHASGLRTLDLSRLAASLEAGGIAWLHVGWYLAPTRWELAHQRRGGHWVSLVRVTVGDDPDGAAELWLNDPAPYAGDEPRTERVRTHRLLEGWLLADGDRLSATQALVLGDGMRLKRPEDVAIVDGAVSLRLAPP